MFPLGHLGIGTFAAGRRVSTAGLPWFLLGTLLPDIVDKPLYYALRLAFGHPAGLVVGTRTFGHTLLFVILLFAVLPQRIGGPLSLGLLTHLALDVLGDFVGQVFPWLSEGLSSPNMLHAVFFPLLGLQFPVLPFKNALEHAATLGKPWVLTGELVGAALLIWQWKAGLFAPLRRARHLAPEQSESAPPAR